MREKGHNQTLGKSGKRHPKGFPYPVGEYGSPAGAVVAPLRCRKLDHSPNSRRRALVSSTGAAVAPLRCRRIDRSRHIQRTGHALVNSAGAVATRLLLLKDRSQSSQWKDGACAGDFRRCCCKASSLLKRRLQGIQLKACANEVRLCCFRLAWLSKDRSQGIQRWECIVT